MCGNCKWRDHAARCSVREEGEDDDGGSGDDPSDEDGDLMFLGQRRLPALAGDGSGGRGGSVDNPILL